MVEEEKDAQHMLREAAVTDVYYCMLLAKQVRSPCLDLSDLTKGLTV